MLPSSRFLCNRYVLAAAVPVLLSPMPVAAAPMSVLSAPASDSASIAFDGLHGDFEREPRSKLSELEPARPLDGQGRNSLDWPRPDLGEPFFVEAGPESSFATTWSALPGRGQRETLRQVLRSIATTHSSPQRQSYGLPGKPGGHQSAASAAMSNDAEGRGLAEFLLDSEIIGAMVRSVVEVRAADSDGTIFSVLGLGEFVLDVTPSAHTALLTELSSGRSVGMPLAGSNFVYSTYGASGADGRIQREKINLFRLIWDWVADLVLSPIGILASMVAGIILFVWLGMKSASLLQRRTSR